MMTAEQAPAGTAHHQHERPQYDHQGHVPPQEHGRGHCHHRRTEGDSPTSLNRLTFFATVHCLTGCAVGEVAGMVIGTALGWGNGETVALAVAGLRNRICHDPLAVAPCRVCAGYGIGARLGVGYLVHRDDGDRG